MPPKKNVDKKPKEDKKVEKPKEDKKVKKPKEDKKVKKPKEDKKVKKSKEDKKVKKPKVNNVLIDNNIIDNNIIHNESEALDTNDTKFQSDYREIIETYNPSNNKTSSILTIYEVALIVGKRATQLTYGADPIIDYDETDTPEKIAIKELLSKKIPFIIKRQINNIIEYWKIDDMELDEEAISIYD